MYLIEKEYWKWKDFLDKEKFVFWEWNEKMVIEIEKLIVKMLMFMWSRVKGSMVNFEDGIFLLNI